MTSNAAATDQTGSVVPGWDEFIASLRHLPDDMLALMPAEMQDDDLIRHETGRLALTAIAKKTLDMLGADGDAPMFMPTLNYVLRCGQPNPDIIYRTAIITPGGSYRFTGRRGSLYMFVVTQQIPPADRTYEDSTYVNAKAGAELDMASVTVDAEDRYDVLISPVRPDGYEGDWWQLDPLCNCLIVRLLSADWGKEVDPTMSIERLDRPIGRRRPPPAVGEARLRNLAQIVPNHGLRFTGRLQMYRSEGCINQVKPLSVLLGRENGNYYYEGTYELADDEALVYESDMPATCGYRAILLTNALYETTDWYNHQSCLNHTQAPVDPDGKLRMVISDQDPGIPNWLDTGGYPIGLIQGRWWDADSCPVPVLTRVKLADVRRHLHPDTPAISFDERQAVLRQRRRAFMQRPIW